MTKIIRVHDVFFLRPVYIDHIAYFRYRGTFVESRYGPGSGPIWLNNVDCVGNERSIGNCSHWNAQRCNHSKDVSVSCGTSPVQFGKKLRTSMAYQSIFTARCTIVHSAVLRLHVVCLSVCPFVCP